MFLSETVEGRDGVVLVESRVPCSAYTVTQRGTLLYSRRGGVVIVGTTPCKPWAWLQALCTRRTARRPSACGFLSGSWASCPARTPHVGPRRVTPGHVRSRRSALHRGAGTLASLADDAEHHLPFKVAEHDPQRERDALEGAVRSGENPPSTVIIATTPMANPERNMLRIEGAVWASV